METKKVNIGSVRSKTIKYRTNRKDFRFKSEDLSKRFVNLKEN